MKGKKRVTATTWTDPDDAPELNDEFFERADEYDGQKLIKRGRPPSSSTKISTTIRFDAEIVAAFRADGPGWQSRMNDALREWLSQRRAN
jgi:uncharacterized protein (DUF4415 family)|nr:hypothetical protein [Oxalobacteraceae bacterium]